MREGAGWSGSIGNIGSPGFNEVEKFNRTLAAWVGKSYAEELAQQVAKGGKGSLGATKALEKMGLDVKAIAARGGQLTEEEQIRAARNIVERTQFKVDPQDLPGWASSPWGKMVMQFKTFAYNQTAFMAREVITPAMQGDITPLARFLLIGMPIGMAVSEARNLARWRPSEEDPTKRMSQYFQAVGGFGIASDIITGLFPQNSQYLDPNRATTMALGTLGGPTISTAMDAYGSLTNAIQGKPENIERFALKQIPLVGPTIKNIVLPYKPGGRAGTPKNSRKALENYLNKMSKIGTPKTSPVEKYLQKMAR